jgi:hypothetical protein
MNKELTPIEIALMGEVVAEYMGWEYKTSLGQTRLYTIHQDWNRIHEVWEKVRGKLPITNHEIGLAAGAILYGTLLEAFTSLYNTIEFINQLK